MDRVSINIVTWNSEIYITACLKSVFEQIFKNFDVTVVDNGSQDKTLQLIRERFGGHVTIIANPTNEGYCRAHNRAIAKGAGDYILTLNPDVMLAPTFLENMILAINSAPDIGSVNGKLLRVESEYFGEHFEITPHLLTIDSAGLAMLRTRRQVLRGHLADHRQYRDMTYIFGPDGAAALYRREMLEDVKVEGEYFDGDFVIHKEDVDLAWRAQLCGWKSLYVPDAVAYHVRGFRPGRREGMAAEVKRHALKNRYLLIMKNELPQTFLRDCLHILFYDLEILAYVLLFEKSSLPAYWDCLRLAAKMLRKRKEIQKRRRVPSGYMAGLFQTAESLRV